MRKIISVILIVAVLNLTFFAQQKDAEAAVPAILFHPAVTCIAVPLLAYGISYLTVQGLVALSNGAWQNWFSDETKSKIDEAQETGRLEITEQVDNDFRNLAQNFRDTQVKYLTEGELQYFDIDRDFISFDSDVLYGNARVFVNPGYYFTSATIYLTDYLSYEITTDLDVVDGELKYAWQLYESDSGVNTLLYETEYIYEIDEMPAQELSVFLDENGNIEVNALGFEYSKVKPGVTFRSIDIVDESSGFVQFNGVTAAELIKGVNYEIDDNYKNTSLVGKAIPIDTSLTYDQIMEKTPAEVHESAEQLAPPGIGEEIGTVTGWLSNVWSKLQDIWNSVREIPRTIADNVANVIAQVRAIPAAIQGVLVDVFVPTISFADVITNVKDVAITRAPFSWINAFVMSANISYGDEPIVIEWQPGLNGETVGVTVPRQTGIRNFSTVVITVIALFTGYHEVRRWIG